MMMSKPWIPASLRRDYISSLPNADDTEQIKIQKLQQLYHYRHDLIHYLCEQIIGIKSNFETLKNLSDTFTDLPENFSKLSPDIVYEQNNVITFIDISVSGNYQYNLSNKESKYLPVLQHLSSKGYTTNPFYMFWVDPAWSNLEESILNFVVYLQNNSLPNYKPSLELLDLLKTAHEDVSSHIQTLRISIPIDLLNMFDKIDNPKYTVITNDQAAKCCEKNYPFYADTIEELNNSTLGEVETLFETLIDDIDIRSYIRDDKHSHAMYSRAFNSLKEFESKFPVCTEKPSFFIPYANFNDDTLHIIKNSYKGTIETYPNFPQEQKQVVNMLSLILDLNKQFKDPSLNFMAELFENLSLCLKSQSESSIFSTGMLTGDINDEMLLTKKYNEFRKENGSTISKRTFFKNMLKTNDLRDVLPYVYRNKCLKLPVLNSSSKIFINKSGTSYRKTHNVREYVSKQTIDTDSYQHFEKFLDLLEETTSFPYNIHPFLGSVPGCDSKEMLSIKQKLLQTQREFLGYIQHTNCHSMSKHTSLIASQLLHFNELNTTDNTYCMFTGGQPNILHIVRGGSLKRGADIGQAFFTVFVTNDIRWCSKVYGNIETFKFKRLGKYYYLCRTPWVRLSSERLSFMKDQYYSTLSTAFDTWARNKMFVGAKGFFKHMYSFRVCVSLSPSQRIAELLMDTRYIFMSALSTYSNVEKLILDKFAPPYKNSLEQYIVRQLNKKSQQIIIYLESNPPKPNKPGFSGKERLNYTLGGTITLPSLWSEFILQDLQSIFDDIFVYVHTSKEASSEYHEQIKAINTILKYQYEYDKLGINMKKGLASSIELKSWLLSGSQVGCSSKTVYQGTKLFSNKFKGLYKSWEFKTSCLEEPLSNIVSTKSCIPEYDRKEVLKERTKKEFDRVLKNINSLMKSGKSEYIVNGKKVLKQYYAIDVHDEEKASIVITNQNRVKVHDALIDWIERFGHDKNYVIDLATWNILKNNCKVLTDTCIKAQYGAKREFYVINLGAKAMARVTENSYKSLAKVCKNEMISIPGDRKLVFIQDAVNESILSSERRQDVLMYVNGDCTKWSACETMASFISMNHGLREVFGENIYNYNMVTFTSWANKQIQIPQNILMNLRFISDSTKYIEQGTTIHSTQNFLQGMLNYSSSIKAVISTEFALHMFKKRHPDTFLHCSHLEHSDDYSLIVRTKNLEIFEEFRMYHKLSQKLFGINDSIKKTNIQSHIQEFISLFSFNGQLYYPFIKKTKEVGTNLPCTDYRSDVMSITSRVSECVRIGVSIESAYFMQRVHCASIADAYSITPKMRNSVGDTLNIFSRPFEIFGLPDCLPILSTAVKGCVDNYRLYKYGSNDMKDVMKGLYVLGQSTYDLLDLPVSTIKEEMGELYNPKFSYPTRHNRIKMIRNKLHFSYEDALVYFKENLTDSLVKPVETQRFLKWLKSMYFNHSFVRAYMRVSRSAMTLRHSLFSSKPCILEIHSHLDNNKENPKEYTTIKNYILNVLEESKQLTNHFTATQEKLLNNHINCYNNCIELFYLLIKDSILVPCEEVETHTTVNRMPDPFKWLNLENNVSNLLQFLINPQNFYNDRRVFISETSLGRDIKRISQIYDINLLKVSPSYCRQIFSEIMAQGSNRAYGLTFINDVPDLTSYYKQYLERGLFYNKNFNFVPTQKMQLKNMKTDEIFYQRDWKTNMKLQTGVLSQFSLIYRAIILSNDENIGDKLTNMLSIYVDEMKCDFKTFLQNTTLEKLDELQVGELTRKMFCFLKSRLLVDSLDLHKYVKSKFFYEVSYIPLRQVLKPFKEEAIIGFLNMKFRAYLYEEGTKQYILLELKNTNRVMWFYCYSIAQRIFGLINQVTLDERLLETKDFVLPILPIELNYLFESIMIPKYNPLFYKRMGSIFRQTTNFKEADIPIVIQNVKFPAYYANKHVNLNSANIHTTELGAYTGNITLFKLPFGNLVYQNYIDLKDQHLLKIDINGFPLHLILKHNLLEKYLKTNCHISLKPDEALELINQAISNKTKNNSMPKSYKDLYSYFNLDLLSKSGVSDLYDLKISNMAHHHSNSDVNMLSEHSISKSLSLRDQLVAASNNKQNNLFEPGVLETDRPLFSMKFSDIDTIQDESQGQDDNLQSNSQSNVVVDKNASKNDEMARKKLENLKKLGNLNNFGLELTFQDDIKQRNEEEQKSNDLQEAMSIFGLGPLNIPAAIEKKSLSSEENIESGKMTEVTTVSDVGSFSGLNMLRNLQFLKKSEDMSKEKKTEDDQMEQKVKSGGISSNTSSIDLQEQKHESTGKTDDKSSNSVIGFQFDESSMSSLSNLMRLKQLQQEKISSDKEMKPKEMTNSDENRLTSTIALDESNETNKSLQENSRQGLDIHIVSSHKADHSEFEEELEEKDENVHGENSLTTQNMVQISNPNIAEVSSVGTQLTEGFLSRILKSKMTDVSRLDETNLVLDVKNELTGELFDKLNLNSVEIINPINVASSFAGINARQVFQDYSDVVSKRTNKYGHQKNETSLQTIEESRNDYTKIWDIDNDELGELFEQPEDLPEYERSMSSDSSSSDSEGLTWFQLVPSTHLIEGSYNFEIRCRESMLEFNEYILTSIVNPDIENMVASKKDANNLICLINFIGKRKKQLDLSKEQKNILRAAIISLKKVVSMNPTTVYAIGHNIGFKFSKGKIRFLAMKAFENKKQASRIASNNPKITIEKDLVNFDDGALWLSAELTQDDLEEHLSKGFSTEEFDHSTPFSRLLSKFIPRIKVTDFGLRSDYGF